MPGRLALNLDLEMLAKRGVRIPPGSTEDGDLARLRRTPDQVVEELGSRFLVRYMMEHQIGLFLKGSSRQHWVTPTPYSSEDAIHFLALTQDDKPRTHYMVLDISKLDGRLVWGPRRVRFGIGIEYLLPNGFPAEAIVSPGPQSLVRRGMVRS